jgi:hypothetical protein
MNPTTTTNTTNTTPHTATPQHPHTTTVAANRRIENITRTFRHDQDLRLDPRKPMPHIICPEARPHMERPASVWPPLLAGAVVGSVIGVTLVNYFS